VAAVLGAAAPLGTFVGVLVILRVAFLGALVMVLVALGAALGLLGVALFGAALAVGAADDFWRVVRGMRGVRGIRAVRGGRGTRAPPAALPPMPLSLTAPRRRETGGPASSSGALRFGGILRGPTTYREREAVAVKIEE
jgi:hypothetical protein